MKKPNVSGTGPQHGPDKGFALVISLTMLILLTVIAVAMLSLSAINLRSSSQQSAMSEAQANARLALMIAIGELQTTLGPDQRISARGATLAQHPGLGVSVDPASARGWWVGAAHSDAAQRLGSGNQAVVWLVSGINPQTPPQQQITAASPFANPVEMFTDHSIDTALLTGGRPIEAGKVGVLDGSGRRAGSYAWFIDDNGMKAQLAATHPLVRNDEPTASGGVLPGTYNLGVLHRMEALGGASMDDYTRLGSLNDLPLIGGDRQIAPAKRMGYTTRSHGVLADVRKGGLKRDLTIAFENETTFNAVFPNNDRGANFGSGYLVMDAERLNNAAELKQNGYIHWRMLHNYYNLKKHIRRVNRIDVLDPVQFNKNGFIVGGDGNPLGRGALGPHQIGANPSTPAAFQQLPYGDYPVMDQRAGKNAGFYRHSPVFPVLQRMQQNAWIEHIPPATAQLPHRVRTRVQLWTSHYNPYNITIQSAASNPVDGPRVMHFPQVRFSMPGVSLLNNNGQTQPFTNISGLANKRQSHVNETVFLEPGRSHVMAFRNDTVVGQEIDNRLYSQRVRNLVLQSVFGEYRLAAPPRGNFNLDIDFYMQNPATAHGTDMNPPQADGDHEVAQVFWAPIAWNAVNNNRPGKTISRSISGVNQLNENNMASSVFRLRTTREPGDSVRPLIDANIRAQLSNPKWDAPLGLPTLAGYSAANGGEAIEPFFPMATNRDDTGFTYWGAGDDPMNGHDRVILFDIPRMDLVSLGQLQHANVGRFSYEPTYIVGNSYANPRIPLDDWRATVTDSFSTAARGLQEFAIPGRFSLYDASYLVNEELWDSYIFTTLPQVADNHAGPREPAPTDAHFRALLEGDALLPNPRFLPYEPPGSSFVRATLQQPSSPRGATGSFYHNAGHLLIDGAFNVNSTSVDAWEAFLSGTHGLPYQELGENGIVGGFSPPVDGVRFPRVQNVMGGPMDTSSPDENYWIGFRRLQQNEVRDLAEAIVDEIRKRGPFLSLGEFVNRKLERGELGERGALQAALDTTVNSSLGGRYEAGAGHSAMPANSSQGAGFPGQLLQGDILQALSPFMTVRSDSFTIRAYGESLDAAGNVRARAWCEAVVQRYPDPLPGGTAGSALAELITPSHPHGRMFRLQSFRWLNVNEV